MASPNFSDDRFEYYEEAWEALGKSTDPATDEGERFWQLIEMMMEEDLYEDLSADGDFANILVEFGLREEDWDWDVGDTPGTP